MSDDMEDVARRLVVGRKSDGRSVYDEAAKAEVPAAWTAPWPCDGVSVPAGAQAHHATASDSEHAHIDVAAGVAKKWFAPAGQCPPWLATRAESAGKEAACG